MSKIKNIIARQILDSRGNPTIEVDVILESEIMGRASVASGASTGTHEALELRDNNQDYMGKGVMKAVNNVNGPIRKLLVGMNSLEQEKIDASLIKLDGTNYKSKLGANAILAVSMANLKASANYKHMPLYKYIGNNLSLPIPLINIINGGVHANNNLTIQEFMIIPSAKTIKERIKIGTEVFMHLKKLLQTKGYPTTVGDEGGFAPNLNSNIEALELIKQSIILSGYTPGRDVYIALDIAANEIYKNGYYEIEKGQKLNRNELIDYYINLCKKYPIISLEDPLEETDFKGFKLLTEKLGKTIQIVGDDLFTTNQKYLNIGIKQHAANAIIIKMNQIGTITETIQTINLAKKHNYRTIISHRSGETEDTIIAHLAVGLDLKQIKTGSLSRGERTMKYNELIRIEEEIENINNHK